MLVVCVAFRGQRPTQPLSVYQKLYFGATDSVASYYRQVSYGKFNLRGAVIGNPLHPAQFLQLPHGEAYYAGKNNGSSSPFPRNDDGLVADVVHSLQRDHFNFAPYAERGQLPYLSIVFTGYGADVNPQDSSLIWPVENTLARSISVPLRATAGQRHTALPAQLGLGVSGAAARAQPPAKAAPGEVVVSNYALVPELADQSGSPSTLGVYVHEMGHLLGLDDMYDTSPAANAGQGDGPWTVMGTGNWNGYPQGADPAELDPFSRTFLGWIHPVVIAQSVTGLSLPPIETQPVVYELRPANYAGEYFLVDNVQPISFDKALPGRGVMIWRIDARQAVPTSYDWVNDVLNTPSQNHSHHYDISIVQASGRKDLQQPAASVTAYADTYPNAVNNSWTAVTHPSNTLWNGAPLGMNITHISVAKSGVATLDVQDTQSGASLTIPPPAEGLRVYQGQRTPLGAIYQVRGRTAVNVAASADWRPLTPGVAIARGVATFSRPGPAVVSAYAHGLSAQLRVTVVERAGTR